MSGVMTRSVIEENRRLFEETLTITLGLTVDHPILLALSEESITTFNDLPMLSPEDIDDLSYTTYMENEGESTAIQNILSKGHKGWIKALIAFIRYHNIDSDEEIKLITLQEFNKFRLSKYDPTGMKAYTTNKTKTTKGNKVLNSAEIFKKTIKRDKSHYTILREDKQWDKWNRSTIATARTHDCDHVFDINFVPIGEEQQELFDEKQKFIYSVFEEKVLTNTGKALVRKYERSFDAQKIYKGLLAYSKESTQATIDTAELLQYISTVKLHKVAWKGTYHAFILHWCDKLRLYEDMVSVDDHFTHRIKRVMLQNAVAGVPSLNHVKTVSDHDKAHGKGELSYDSYVNLLLSAASTHDANIGFTSKSRLKAYLVNQEYYNIHNHDFQIDHEEIYNIDTACITDEENLHEIYQTNINSYKSYPTTTPRMAKEKWLSLSRPEQQAWNTLSNKSKAIILGSNEPTITKQEEVLINYTEEDKTTPLHKPNQVQVPNQHEECDSDNILSYLSKQHHPGDIRNVLSTPKNKLPSSFESSDKKTKSKINSTELTYTVSSISTKDKGSLIDRGANGGLAGDDVKIICYHDPPRYIDVSGINSHKVEDLQIVTAGGVAPSQRGPVIIILHQYAYLGKGNSVHSCIQLESYKNKVDDRAMVHGGTQTITTPDGYVHPLNFVNGLAYLPLRPFTNNEWKTLPHVIWTSDERWDPSSSDQSLTNIENWGDKYNTLPENNNDIHFNEYGEYVIPTRAYDPHNYHENLQHVLDMNRFEIIINKLQLHLHQGNNANIHLKHQDIQEMKPYLLHMDDEIIKNTIKATTQYGRTNSNALQLKQTYRTPFPACNVTRRNEPVATDTVYSNSPAIDDGSTLAQIFVGRETLVIDIYPIKTEKQFIQTLQENIRRRGAMDILISDRGKVEVSKQCHNILRAYCIKDWQSEPHYQHQNFAERKYSQIKPLVNRLLNSTGAPPEIWLLALEHVARVLNHTANKTLRWRTPLQALTGIRPDISSIMIYQFWEKVYYKDINADFPSDSSEKLGRFVGVADNVGHALTYKVLSTEEKIIFRSRLRSATHTDLKNKILEPETTQTLRSKFERDGVLPTIDVDDLIGKTFLREPSEDGTRLRAKIVENLSDEDDNRTNDPRFIRFRCTVNDGEFEDIVTYMDIINRIEKDDNDENEWKFKSITGHQGPLSKSDPEYKGSRFNVLVNWDSGESTYEPLDLIARDDPVTCALYGKKNNLLEKTGWKRFKRIMSREERFSRFINTSRLQHDDRDNYQFGILIPRNHKHAMEIDLKTGNKKWFNAEQLELKQIHEYNTFIDKGKNFKMPPDFTRIQVHFVYAAKHDGRYKARLVAGGHLTSIPDDSIYSGVVSLKGIRLITFLGRLNNLKIFSTDIGNAYLEADTKEKVYIIAGSEFGELEGHTLIINKALYGLRSSGLRWHEHLADSLRAMGFNMAKAEDDIWMRRKGKKYEYVASYVDDLCIVAKQPELIIQHLQDICKYKLKGTGPIKYHLGCDYFFDDDDNLCYAPRKYIGKLIEDYTHIFGHKPKQYWSPLEQGDHPETDTSEELDENGTKQYQSMIGSLQWAISLGRFDISTAVMSLSSFRASPRKGHLQRAKRIYGYLAKFKDAAIRIRTDIPNYSEIDNKNYEWETTVYGGAKEIIPNDIPTPLGKTVQLTTYVDANLFHDIITGRSVTGILHLINKTPFDWYSKKQATVETATYGSEFTAARIAVDQIITNRNILRYLGVPIIETTFMFGDNKSVIDNSSIPHSKLHKRHNFLSFHRVREAIAAGIITFNFIPGSINPADLLSKHWGHQQIKTVLKTLLFYEGNTYDLFDDPSEDSMN